MLDSAKAARLSLLMTVGFGCLALNLVQMQLLNGDVYRALSEKNRLRVIYLPAARGRILDRRGEALASSRLSYNCSAVALEAGPRIRESLEILSPILGREVDALQKRFSQRKPSAFNTALIAEDIPASQAMVIEEKLDTLPGFMIETTPVREYAYGEVAAHLVGFIGPLTEEEAEESDSYGYAPADWIGRGGVEKVYESYLRGRSGGLQMEVDPHRRFVKALGVREPEEGKSVQLTVDAKLQAFIQNQFRDQKGCVLVMELEEGALLAVNSSPSFDPNLFSSSRGRTKVGKYLNDARGPMLNRALSARYPPGSIFKVVTALAALEKRKISLTTSFQCPGHWVFGGNRFRCWKESGHGAQALAEAFAHSCNVYFYHAGFLAGLEALVHKAAGLGLGDLTEVDLPGEKKGFIPSKEWKKKTLGESWYDGDTANLSIGQGYLEVTPIEALVMISTVATKGRQVRPHVIDRIAGVKVGGSRPKTISLSTNYLDTVKQGLIQVIESDTGTGRLARVPGLRIAGKTGTAESGQKKTHAWFAGFAPAEHPKIAAVVFLEHGGRGGVSAATLAGAVFGWLKENAYL